MLLGASPDGIHGRLQLISRSLRCQRDPRPSALPSPFPLSLFAPLLDVLLFLDVCFLPHLCAQLPSAPLRSVFCPSPGWSLFPSCMSFHLWKLLLNGCEAGLGWWAYESRITFVPALLALAKESISWDGKVGLCTMPCVGCVVNELSACWTSHRFVPANPPY